VSRFAQILFCAAFGGIVIAGWLLQAAFGGAAAAEGGEAAAERAAVCGFCAEPYTVPPFGLIAVRPAHLLVVSMGVSYLLARVLKRRTAGCPRRRTAGRDRSCVYTIPPRPSSRSGSTSRAGPERRQGRKRAKSSLVSVARNAFCFENIGPKQV